jgi:hypothetical protein
MATKDGPDPVADPSSSVFSRPRSGWKKDLMTRIATGAVLLGLVLTANALADGKYSLKPATTEAPAELAEPIRALLAPGSLQVTDAKGTALCELWVRKDIPSKATAEQVKNGLTYRELDESLVLGAIRFDQTFTDFRKQKIKPGVYTLRIGFQPMDGDHMGTAPYQEFCLVSPAKADQKPDLMETKELREMSAKSTGTAHPSVMLLFPNEKPGDTPKLEDKGNDIFVAAFKRPVMAGSEKTSMGFALTVVGHTMAE